VAERREDLRAADVDRQFVADRLRAALDEGRLSLHEYDDRLRDTYAARTYGDLDGLLADLPGEGHAQLVPRPPSSAAGPQPASAPQPPRRRGSPRWILAAWSGWLTVAIIVNAIWLASVLSGADVKYWPIWVMGPWGAVLLASTVNGLIWGSGGSDRDRKEAKRRERRARRQERRGY
jgi:hypothetical protein